MADLSWLLDQPYAHRGLFGPENYTDTPENSLAAFRKAVAAGVGAELDVRLSRDGEAVVFHDDNLNRMTGVDAMTGEMEAVHLTDLFLGQTDEKIPTLAQALSVMGARQPVLIELKTPFDKEGPLEERVAAILERYPGPAAVMSFNPLALARMADLAPDRPRGLLSYLWDDEAAKRLPWRLRKELSQSAHAEAAGAHFLGWEIGDIARGKMVASAKGLPLLAWTVRGEADRAKAKRYADGMIFEGDIPARW